VNFQILDSRFFSTHHASAADVLAGNERAPVQPAYALLVGRARRFTSLVTQMFCEVTGELHRDASLAVFATCHGEIQTAEKLIADIRDHQPLSSARFALSVHNTASGLYSVATASTEATTTITGTNAVAAGWLEAVLTALDSPRPVLLAIADEPVPASFRGPAEHAGVAAAFLIARGTGKQLAFVPHGEPVATPLALARAVEGQPVVLGEIAPGQLLEMQ
jgi:hypothetical protein